MGGGHDGKQALRSAERYDPKKGEWEVLPPMHTPRSDPGISCMDGCIYACGGHNGKHALSSVERFEPRTSTWKKLQHMSKPRQGITGTVLVIPVQTMLVQPHPPEKQLRCTYSGLPIACVKTINRSCSSTLVNSERVV